MAILNNQRVSRVSTGRLHQLHKFVSLATAMSTGPTLGASPVVEKFITGWWFQTWFLFSIYGNDME